ncbi:hypothetical protein F0U62_17800 [Cystobacter fuscus]|uniref:hypothetical protein n=1 Tax=Cystobacter fuscus TaxID=43 RepID=UPI002B2A451E|nr:hypothetical protein F0U62_17800 [Cystobacter fuscus]
MSSLPPVPAGQETFYYASQTTFWIFFRQSRALVERALGAQLDSLGLALPRFKDDPDSVYLALVPSFYTCALNLSSGGVTSTTMPGVSEAEFNVLVHPKSQAARLPDLTFQEFLLGWEQHKLIGQLRLDVITDNMGAVIGGREKYGEHKFRGFIRYCFPLPNDNARTPVPFHVEFSAYTTERMLHEELVFSLRSGVGALQPVSVDASEVVVYGALPPEPQDGTRQRAIGSRRNHFGTFSLYMPTEVHTAQAPSLQYGPCHNAAPLHYNGKSIPGAEEWPKQMRDRMRQLLTDAPVAAFMLFASPPVEIEPRPFYVDPQ